jgi:hypothetical protein
MGIKRVTTGRTDGEVICTKNFLPIIANRRAKEKKATWGAAFAAALDFLATDFSKILQLFNIRFRKRRNKVNNKMTENSTIISE